LPQDEDIEHEGDPYHAPLEAPYYSIDFPEERLSALGFIKGLQ
jgi:hypothetical protein